MNQREPSPSWSSQDHLRSDQQLRNLIMTSHICTRCGFQNQVTVWQCYQCGAALNSIDRYSVWRKNSVLIMTRQALLPDRCIKCNEPAERKLKRKLSWHHPAIYLLVFGGALFYVLLAIVMRKTATIEVGLCENHSAMRQRDIAFTWALGLRSEASSSRYSLSI